MMNKLLKGVFAASGVVLVAGCSDTFDPSGDRVGRILPSVELDTQVAAPDSQSSKVRSRAEGTTVSVSDLRLRLTATEGDSGYSYNSPEELYGQDVAVGGYLLEAFYGSDADEGYGKPYYYGSQQLTVLDGKTTPVSLTASLANAIVTVQYTDAVKGYFTSYGAKVRTSSGTALEVVNDAAELLYVKPGTIDINVDVVRPTGVAATLNPFSFTAEPRHHYYVTFDINNGAGGGNASLTVTFNSATIDEEVEINISDQVLSAPAPTIALSGTGDGLEFIEGSTPAEPLRAVIVAQGGLKTARLYTSSASLLAQGWPAEVDFATATPAQLATMRSLGLAFPGLEGVKSEMGMLDFTEVVKHVAYVTGGDNTTSFNIIAQDNLTKVSEPVSFGFSISPIELTLGEVEPLYPDATEMALTMAYNGSNLAEDVKFSYFNDLGVWKALPVKSVTPVSRTATTTYRVVLEVPANGDVTFRAECGSVVTENVTVTRSQPAHSYAFDSNDVFATRATGSMVTTDGSDAATALASARLYISADGAKYDEVSKTVSGNTFSLSGLAPSTTYYLKGSVDGNMCRPVTFTTEAASQLPNAGMEDWEINGSASNWECYYVGKPWGEAVWGTNNPMTTSQGGNFGYVRISGTKPVDNGHNGKAACISTQGWGSGNSALTGVSGKCKYIDAGLLHLGASRTARPEGYGDGNVSGPLFTSDLDCGIAFSSRPSALSFYYKYEKKNDADRGVAKAYVYDAEGNEIASGVIEVDAQSSFIEGKIPLTYQAGAPKAARIYVCFLSSNSESHLIKNSSYLNGPGLGNLSRGEYSASRFYIDDITLEY